MTNENDENRVTLGVNTRFLLDTKTLVIIIIYIITICVFVLSTKSDQRSLVDGQERIELRLNVIETHANLKVDKIEADIEAIKLQVAILRTELDAIKSGQK